MDGLRCHPIKKQTSKTCGKVHRHMTEAFTHNKHNLLEWGLRKREYKMQKKKNKGKAKIHVKLLLSSQPDIQTSNLSTIYYKSKRNNSSVSETTLHMYTEKLDQ